MGLGIRRFGFEELDPRLRAALQARVDRLGYLGEFFAVAAHQPDALLGFNAFTESLKQALPDELAQVVALTVAAEAGNGYERCQHEQLAERLGFSHEWIAAAIGSRNSTPLSEPARRARLLAVAMLADHGHGVDAQITALRESADDGTVVAVLLLVGRYVAHAVVSNALGLRPPVPPVLTEPVR